VLNRKIKHLGIFDNEKEASEYYENALIAIQNGTDIIVKKPIYSSKYLGVSLAKNAKKWTSRIIIDKKDCYLGSFHSEADAAIKYNEVAVKHFGENAKLNKIHGSVLWNRNLRKIN
jgi:hypothetical protein